MTKKILILGASGMLGNQLLRIFVQDNSYEIIATTRSDEAIDKTFSNVNWKILDTTSKNSQEQLRKIATGVDYVINCIGLIKSHIRDNNAGDTKKAILINSIFPQILSELSQEIGFKVLQIATDCVYSGLEGYYSEKSQHDAFDVYGKTKSLGEILDNKNFYNLRCSIIGKEKKSFTSLLEWLLKQPLNSSINGFTNHYWNGITTYHFGKICLGIIKNDLQIPTLQHIIPANALSKAELLKIFAKQFNRTDLLINFIETKISVNRTLATQNNELNHQIWQLAGYKSPPTIEQMVEEISKI